MCCGEKDCPKVFTNNPERGVYYVNYGWHQLVPTVNTGYPIEPVVTWVNA